MSEGLIDQFMVDRSSNGYKPQRLAPSPTRSYPVAMTKAENRAAAKAWREERRRQRDADRNAGPDPDGGKRRTDAWRRKCTGLLSRDDRIDNDASLRNCDPVNFCCSELVGSRCGIRSNTVGTSRR